MRRKWTLIGVLLLVATAYFALANGKEPSSGPLTGTWECVAHSSVQDDVSFTLGLKQDREEVAGKFVNSTGEYPLTSASYKKGVLEFHVDASGRQVSSHGKVAAWPIERPLVEESGSRRWVGVPEIGR